MASSYRKQNSLDNFLDISLFFSDNVNGVLLFFQGYTVSLLKDNKDNVMFLTLILEIFMVNLRQRVNQF